MPCCWRRWLLLPLLICPAWVACGPGDEPPAAREAAQPAPPPAPAPAKTSLEQEEIRAIVDSEELLLALTARLADLGASAKNLRLPDHRSASLFAPTVTTRDLAQRAEGEREVGFASPLAQILHWKVQPEERTAPLEQLDLWRPLFDGVEYLKHAKFKFVRGAFPKGRRDAWEADLAFSAVAALEGGGVSQISASVDTRWIKTGVGGGTREKEAAAWQLDRFDIVRLTTIEGERPLFQEVSQAVLAQPEVRARARNSLHERYLMDWARQDAAWKPPHRYFRVKPTDWQPGLAVVDLDRDGLDDVYVMDRWGPNLMLRNRGDGTFEDVAASVGLDFEDHNCCAVFADFDNDGDSDLFLGRTLLPSLYLANEDGRFVDRSDQMGAKLPALVTSVAAVDYDGDGLLDVYFSTYAAELMDALDPIRRKAGSPLLLEEFLPKPQARRLAKILPRSHRFLGRAGPPNLLLRNQGGGSFARAPNSGPVSVWRNTFQTTWSDFDGDGDPDLYIANDFAPNNLVRNDGEAGFTDITKETETADIGFGMGASWGDYDNDGRHDLYVTNMFSKAGQRITQQVRGLDPRLANMSRGNTLFRNAGERFEKVSGLDADSLAVEKAGWSWGGQFVDVDNDGYLDLYASSGMYTAPRQIEIEGADT